MKRKCYSDYLLTEINTIRILIIRLQEQIDELLHVQAPLLEEKYSELFGAQEDEIQKAEMECELTQKKLTLIQRAINRREPVDMEAIDQEIDKLRLDMMVDMIQTTMTNDPLPLTEESGKELQTLYRRIVQDFHPSAHPELTDMQKTLYDKAMQAYRRHDLQELSLIHDVLDSAAHCDFDKLSVTMALGGAIETVDDAVVTLSKLEEFSTDYTLARELYSFFDKPEAELIAESTIGKLQKEARDMAETIEGIRNDHPFSAQVFLNDPERAAEYRAQLGFRLQTANNKLHELESRVAKYSEGT